MTSEEHDDEVDRLWRAFKRDLSSAILEMAGIHDGKAVDRLMKTWGKLCDLDLDVATSIYHGVEQIHIGMARNNEPRPSIRYANSRNWSAWRQSPGRSIRMPRLKPLAS